jgi:hypothetical protein
VRAARASRARPAGIAFAKLHIYLDDVFPKPLFGND